MKLFISINGSGGRRVGLVEAWYRVHIFAETLKLDGDIAWLPQHFDRAEDSYGSPPDVFASTVAALARSQGLEAEIRYKCELPPFYEVML